MAPSKSDRSSFLGLRDRNANLVGLTKSLLGAGKKFTLDTVWIVIAGRGGGDAWRSFLGINPRMNQTHV